MVALVVAIAAGAACGPIAYTGEVRRASGAIDAARAAHADKYAPYWWTRATQYFHKAREVVCETPEQAGLIWVPRHECFHTID